MRLAILALAGVLTGTAGLYLEGLLMWHRLEPEEEQTEEPEAGTARAAEPVIKPDLNEVLNPPLAAVPLFGTYRLKPPQRDSSAPATQLVPYWAQALVLEVALGVVFLLLGLKLHITSHVILACIYTALLFEMAVIDFHYRLVLNLLSFPSAAIAIAGASFWSGIGLRGSLLGGISALVLFFIIEIVGRGAMGRGDTKLAAVIGFMRGFPAVWGAIIAGILIGGVMAAALLLSGRGRKTTFAYGPALAIGGVVSFFIGRG